MHISQYITERKALVKMMADCLDNYETFEDLRNDYQQEIDYRTSHNGEWACFPKMSDHYLSQQAKEATDAIAAALTLDNDLQEQEAQLRERYYNSGKPLHTVIHVTDAALQAHQMD